MKKPVLYVIIILVVIFVVQVFRNSSVTDIDDSKSPMYGFERDTTPIVIPPRMVADNGSPVQDPMKAIKEQLYADKYHWFANQEAYMLKDDDFVDPIVTEVLATENDGKLPKNIDGVDEIARQVMYAYSRKIKEPEGLARLENLIQKRYDSSTVSIDRYRDYYTKTVDLGVLPAKLSVSVRHGIIRTRNTGVMDEDGRWLSTEIARQILKYNNDHPSKITFKVRFSPYYGGLEKSFLFSYIAKNPDSPFPHLITIAPENAYDYYTSGGIAQTLYLLHTLEDYAENRYSIYEVNDSNIKQRTEF